jgi:hypothetical protein
VNISLTDFIADLDFWAYEIGVNPIPADTRNKRTYEEWSLWQDQQISDEILIEWKKNGKFAKGSAIIVGRIWRGNKQRISRVKTANFRIHF